MVLIALMDDRDEPQAGVAEGRRCLNILSLKTVKRDEPSLIKQFRRESAYRRLKTPRCSKKQALGIANRPSTLKQVGERRNVGALRVAALLRLFQLLRVAQQHQILACRRNR